MRPEQLEPRALLTVTVPPSIDGPFVEIDDNVLVDTGGGAIEGTSSYVQIFGNSQGRIDRATGATDADLVLKAQTSITVTGAIGAVLPFDSLTLESVGGQTVSLQQAVTLEEDLIVVKSGSFSVGSTVDVGGNLTITDATTVLFSGNVTVDGDLTITNATSVTFAGTLTVGGMLTITNATGTTRFVGDVLVAGASVTSTTLVQVLADFTTDAGESEGDADVTFTTDQINFTTATLQPAAGTESATLTIKPRTVSRDLTIASPPGIPSGVNITDADIFAIQGGWKRVVFGDEAAGTGAVRVGSIGSQYGGFSQILNTTTIAGGSISVVQPVDVTTLADYLELLALGDGEGAGAGITIDAPINQTAEERNGWVRLTSAGPIAINAPVWAAETVSLTTSEAGTIAQAGGSAAITALNLAVVADGGVTLTDTGNAVSFLAIKTTDDDVVFREDSGYSISLITTIDDERDVPATVVVTGIDAGTGTVRLVTISGETTSSVIQSRAVIAGGLGLEGAGTDWSLSLVTNDIGTLAADTGSVVFADVDDLTIGTVAAVSPQSALSGITASGTVTVTAATKLTITSAGDIVSQATTGTAVALSGTSGGIETAGDVTTSGGDVAFNQAVTLTGDIAVDVVDGSTTGTSTFLSTINGTTSGQESLAITGDLDARGSIGGSTALESLSVSGDATFAGGISLRTVGDQTYSGKATSTGTITIQAGSGSAVKFLGETSLGGLVTATGDTSAYDVVLTGSPVSITNAVTFANTGTVTLGDADTDSLTFGGGLTSTAPTLTKLAGTIATTNANASFGTAEVTADTVVSTGSGDAVFSGAVDGGFSLSVNASGTTTFGSTVGATTALASLTTDAGGTTALYGGSVKTSGTQTYDDAVTLGANATLTGTTITTKGTVVGGSVVADVLVTGPFSLSIAGDAVFGDAPGDTLTKLGGLIVDGMTTINTSLVSAAPVQQYKGQVTLGTATKLIGALVQFDGSIVGGGNALEVEVSLGSGVVLFGDAPADSVAGLASLTVSGGARLHAATIASTGLQTYGGQVDLVESTTLTASGVEFKAKVEGHQRELTIDAGAAGVIFDGDVGTAAFPIGELDVDSEGNVVINGEIHSSGPVTIESSGGSIAGGANNAIRSKGLASFDDAITLQAATGIGTGTAIAVEAPLGVTAKVTTSGGISLRGIGDLVVPSDGLSAPGTISLDSSANIDVPTGGTIIGGDVVTTKEIRWSVLNATDSGAGSLRQVLANVNAVGDCNASGTDAVILLDVVTASNGAGPTVIQLTSQLPDVAAALTLDGTASGLVLDGGRAVAGGLVYGASATGSILRGVTLRNFTGFGVQLIGVQNMLVDTIVVQSLNTSTSMGLYATGTLTGTKVVGGTFSGGLRGALLDGTRNLVFGELGSGRGNLLANNRAAPKQPKFAGTGIRSQGDCAGTVVEGNTFTNNNYGFAFIGARNLALRNNTFTRNSTAGIFIEGDSSGSSQTGSTFGTGSQRNKKNVLRAKKSRFG